MQVKGVYFEVDGCMWSVDENQDEIVVQNVEGHGEIVMSKEGFEDWIHQLAKYVKLTNNKDI